MPPITPYMLVRLPEAGKIEQRTVSLGAISPDLPRALIAAEDHHFCVHKGVDWDANTVPRNGEAGFLSNANSITMQLAGNLFLWPGDGLLRRGLTVGLAYAIDTVWPKPRILEVYLNIAEWGAGIYGVGAAADAFFHKTPAQLSRNEATLLVAVLKDPRQTSPARPSRDVTDRAAWVAQKMDQRRGSYGCL